MEVDGVEEAKSSAGHAPDDKRVVEVRQKSKGEGERNVFLHPLAIISISDHYTRVAMGGSPLPRNARIIGILFGVQDGMNVSIHDAVEVQVTENRSADGHFVEVDQESINKQKELNEAVYPLYEVLGWYSVGAEATDQDIELQRQMMKHNESPLFLLMNPKPKEGAKELPVTIHESEVHMVNDQPTMIFVTLPFQLETHQAEQISVEHVAKARPTSGVSAIDLHASALSTSLRTLRSRINVLSNFLQDTKEGKIPPNYRLLRQVHSICSQLPAMDSQDFQAEFLRDYSDVLVVAYLASVQKSTGALSELADKYSHAYSHRGRM